MPVLDFCILCVYLVVFIHGVQGVYFRPLYCLTCYFMFLIFLICMDVQMHVSYACTAWHTILCLILEFPFIRVL
jgi:hypothetical protein